MAYHEGSMTERMIARITSLFILGLCRVESRCDCAFELRSGASMGLLLATRFIVISGSYDRKRKRASTVNGTNGMAMFRGYNSFLLSGRS